MQNQQENDAGGAAEAEQELRRHGLEMEEGAMSLEVLLQRWSDRGYAAPYQWLVTDAVRMRGSEEVRERVVMLILKRGRTGGRMGEVQ